MKIYPLKLKPVTKNAIWGGTQIPYLYAVGEKGVSVAEAWMLTNRNDGVNIIENGVYTGMILDEYIKAAGEEKIYGNGEFPLLIKIIDAADRLSVQVHPDDEYAAANGLDAGKTEMWYILDAKPGACLVSGLRTGVTAEEITDAAENGSCEQLLNSIPVKKGDCFYIPAGLVHAIGEGILIAEIQQNSNTTYRLYDYERTDKNGNKRELHISDAAKVIKTSFDLSRVAVNKLVSDAKGVQTTILCECEFFDVRKMKLKKASGAKLPSNGKMAHILCTEGSGWFECENIKYMLNKGDSYLIPVSVNEKCTVSTNNELEIIVSHA